jgi:8-oxo-dGTP pyrophosphatase MutT (NUDIX family)
MPLPAGVGSLRQAAALPVRNGLICLVSSRSGRRWVIPKGNLEPGKSSGEIALQEAWEEAGVVGILQPDPVGSYFYEKAGLVWHVTAFLLQVTEAAEDWPERGLRERCWLSHAESLLRVEEPGLRELLRSVLISKAG